MFTDTPVKFGYRIPYTVKCVFSIDCRVFRCARAGSLELAERERVEQLGHVLVHADDVQHALVRAVRGAHAVRRQRHHYQPGIKFFVLPSFFLKL